MSSLTDATTCKEQNRTCLGFPGGVCPGDLLLTGRRFIEYGATYLFNLTIILMSRAEVCQIGAFGGLLAQESLGVHHVDASCL